jgi:predicted nucleotidyltransferase
MDNILERIVGSLRGLKPFKVILFGSLAAGAQNRDIDLVVVLDTDQEPKNYDEKLANRVMVRNSILELSYTTPIDLLVYSRPEFARFLKINGPFAREISKNGKVLYEKAG